MEQFKSNEQTNTAIYGTV